MRMPCKVAFPSLISPSTPKLPHLSLPQRLTSKRPRLPPALSSRKFQRPNSLTGPPPAFLSPSLPKVISRTCRPSAVQIKEPRPLHVGISAKC
ncbi:hypothetical protein ARMGADRAFT_813160 [Armillaria gallica]|uniref:Uncharacterized protein n=1 Tax=Armillaria gallica TaxID=47427 RepID=A0A2H3CDP7_ARMGA|nr:hypothetical protein ARMGADRAFT_813160 [Armillaria gallica]